MEFVEQLKSQVDIVKVVGEYVRLKKAGAGPRYVGLCPFHTEKTPSFGVHSTHQFYKCFGCDARGDVLKFVMEIERVTFFEALKMLAERHGIPMPKRAEYSDPESNLRGVLHEMHELAARQFQSNLKSPAGAAARTYLTGRGVTPGQIEEFGLGLSDPSGQALLRRFEQEGFPAEHMEASGLILRRQDGSGFFDRFRGRLMFPIHSEAGKIIAFGGRALREGDEPKYLNSPETPIYRKSFVLYNLHRAKTEMRKNARVILVEGYLDAIGVYTAGVHEVVASCGTALTNTQVRAIKRHAEKIVVNFDPDAAGSNAAERSIQMLLDESMHVRVLELSGGLDPDDFVREHGPERYRELVDKAGGYFYWLADRARARFDMRSAEGRVAAFQFLLPSIQRITDRLERAAIANDVAGYLGVEAGMVLDQFRRAAHGRQQLGTKQEAAIPKAERVLLRSLVASPENRTRLLPRLRELSIIEGFTTGPILRVLLDLPEDAPFDFGAFEARLDETHRALLNSVIFADSSGEETFDPEQGMAYLGRLEREERESHVSALKARIRESERAGNIEEAFRLEAEVSRLSGR